MFNRVKYEWPFAVSHFGILDRAKLACFVLANSRLTHNSKTCEVEKQMAEFVGSRYALFTSSGSTANLLLAMHTRDTCGSKNIVVLPDLTWATSASPWIREGFKPHFLDAHPVNLGMNLDLLDRYLGKHANEVACVFPTCVLGYSLDMEHLTDIAHRHGVTVMLDNCEATLTQFNGRNVSSWFTSTTSTYMGHFMQTGEGGFIFTDNETLYKSCLRLRDHGLSRCERISPFQLSSIDEFDWNTQFKIHSLGSNFRNTEVGAFLGLLEIPRLNEYAESRRAQVQTFRANCRSVRLPAGVNGADDVLFSLPLIGHRYLSQRVCKSLSIETRPIICESLLRQPAFQRFYGEYYPTSDLSKYDIDNGRLNESLELTRDSLYVGLGKSTTARNILLLAKSLDTVL